MILLPVSAALFLATGLPLDHALRASFAVVLETPDRAAFQWDPQHQPSWFHRDPPEAYQEFAAEARAAIAGAPTDLDAVVALMSYTRHLGSTTSEIQTIPSSATIPEIRRLLAQGQQGNCGHYDHLLTAFLSSLGWPARNMMLSDADGLGGNVHTMVEAWVASRRQWVALDVWDDVWFAADGAPLSLLDLRDQLLDGQADRLEIRRGTAGTTLPSQFMAYLRAHVVNIDVEASGDLASRGARRYGFLRPFTALLNRAPPVVQGTLNVLVGPRARWVHYLDHDARPYHSLRCRLFVGGLGLWLAVIVTNAMLGLRSVWRRVGARRGGVTPPLRRSGRPGGSAGSA